MRALAALPSVGRWARRRAAARRTVHGVRTLCGLSPCSLHAACRHACCLRPCTRSGRRHAADTAPPRLLTPGLPVARRRAGGERRSNRAGHAAAALAARRAAQDRAGKERAAGVDKGRAGRSLRRARLAVFGQPTCPSLCGPHCGLPPVPDAGRPAQMRTRAARIGRCSCAARARGRRSRSRPRWGGRCCRRTGPWRGAHGARAGASATGGASRRGAQPAAAGAAAGAAAAAEGAAAAAAPRPPAGALVVAEAAQAMMGCRAPGRTWCNEVTAAPGAWEVAPAGTSPQPALARRTTGRSGS